MTPELSLDCKTKVFGTIDIEISTNFEQRTRISLLEFETKKVIDFIIIYIRQRINPVSYVEMNGQRYDFTTREEMNEVIDKLLVSKNYEVVRSDNGLRI